MKDGLLTLDFKNNKLIQVLVGKDKNNKEIDEGDFNDFCRKHLSAASAR